MEGMRKERGDEGKGGWHNYERELHHIFLVLYFKRNCHSHKMIALVLLQKSGYKFQCTSVLRKGRSVRKEYFRYKRYKERGTKLIHYVSSHRGRGVKNDQN